MIYKVHINQNRISNEFEPSKGKTEIIIPVEISCIDSDFNRPSLTVFISARLTTSSNYEWIFMKEGIGTLSSPVRVCKHFNDDVSTTVKLVFVTEDCPWLDEFVEGDALSIRLRSNCPSKVQSFNFIFNGLNWEDETIGM